MANKQSNKAKKIYSTLVSALKKKDWRFKEYEKDLTIVSAYVGDDIPIEYVIRVDAEREIVQCIAPMQFKMAKDKLVDGALAVCAANGRLLSGAFDYDIYNGDITFRLSTSFVGCELSEESLLNIMALSLAVTDEFNDKFLMLSKGAMTLQQFVEQCEQS